MRLVMLVSGVLPLWWSVPFWVRGDYGHALIYTVGGACVIVGAFSSTRARRVR